MKVSRNWLQTYFYSEIPAVDKLSELFTFHSFEVEGVEKIEAKGKAPEDFVMDVKILPDRAHYCLSHRGVAEEVHVITGMPLKKDRDTGKPPEGNRMIATPKIIIEDNNFCRRYMGRRVEGVKVSESPEWMEKYLEAIGERSINNIVDASNIIMFDIGQPLHIFDADKVRGEIKVRAAHEGEKILLLDGKEVTLKSNDFVVSDDEGPLAIAGVKGGKRAGITAETKNIIIESANFDPTAVRRTSTELNLRNESSKRFENEITPDHDIGPCGGALSRDTIVC
jgi:phenylalanyl-tRNA synthetase beta chain